MIFVLLGIDRNALLDTNGLVWWSTVHNRVSEEKIMKRCNNKRHNRISFKVIFDADSQLSFLELVYFLSRA